MGNKIKLYNCDQKHLNTKDTLYLDYLSLIGIKKIEQPNLNFLTKIHQAHIETIVTSRTHAHQYKYRRLYQRR